MKPLFCQEHRPELLSLTLPENHIYKALLPDSNFQTGVCYHCRVTASRPGLEIYSKDIANGLVDENIFDIGQTDAIKCKVGNYFPNHSGLNTAIGVVYWLAPETDGRSEKIVSVDTPEKVWCTDNTHQVYTSSIVNGVENLSTVLALDPSLQRFPAFEWCASKGDAGTYLLATNCISCASSGVIINQL